MTGTDGLTDFVLMSKMPAKQVLRHGEWTPAAEPPSHLEYQFIDLVL
jgi:hypothetical protein